MLYDLMWKESPTKGGLTSERLTTKGRLPKIT